MSNANLPVVTITNFSQGDGNKEVILLTAGEHARELITAEVAYWFGALLSGQGDELADWAALQPVQAAAWKTGATKTTLAEWAESLLQRVVFKVCSQDRVRPSKIELLKALFHMQHSHHRRWLPLACKAGL